MKDEFTYGELVEVRDYNSEEWFERYYIATVEFGDTGVKMHCVHFIDETPIEHSGLGACFREIRKIQKPATALIDILQPKQGTIEYLQEQVEFLQKRLIELELKFEAKEIDEFKTQLK